MMKREGGPPTGSLFLGTSAAGSQRLADVGVHSHAGHLPLEALQRAGVTVECCLSCNVLLGGAASLQEHPIRQFVACGIPVTLNSDDSLRVCTTIGREYAIAATLGFSSVDLVDISRAAVRASFTSEARRQALFKELDETLAGIGSLP